MVSSMLILIFVVAVAALGLALLVRRKRRLPDAEPKRAKLTSRRIASPKSHPVPAEPPKQSTGTNSQNPQEVLGSYPAPAIFISYRREDTSDVTGRIYDRLVQHFGKPSVFKDVDSIPLGVDFRKHLGDSVGRCDVLLTIIGRQWLAAELSQRRLNNERDFVRIEIEAALQRNIPVVPVLVQAASMPNQEDLPETLRPLVDRNGIAVRPDPDFHEDMNRLIRGIEGHLKGKGYA
jgi:TIR domain